MKSSIGRDEFEDKLAAALKAGPAIWTPDCLEPEVLVGLIEQGGSYPDSERLLSHASTCAYCRREFASMRRTLQVADQALKAQTTPEAAITPTPVVVANNLPPQFTSFIGRQVESSMVCNMLAQSRIVTLTGEGGCGKSRLALHVASHMLDQFGGRAWFVELTPLTDPTLLPDAVASA